MTSPLDQMIEQTIVRRGVADQRVLAALRSVPRDHFVPADQRHLAWDDTPLPIGLGQTISQPYIVALMTELLMLRGDERLLEVGAGCGYQTAVLSKLVPHVFSAELEGQLAARARDNLAELGVTNVTLRAGDGTKAFEAEAPFDAILVAAAPREVPQILRAQLADGGRLVIPVGPADDQRLLRIVRRGDRFDDEEIIPVRFVPLR